MTQNDTTEVAIDMTAVLALLDELREMATKLNGAPPHPLDSASNSRNNREKMQASAQRSRDLLYAAHVADGIRFEILSQYHSFKGQHPPLLNV